YARTLKFAWTNFSKPGNHLLVTMSGIEHLPDMFRPTFEKAWQMWADIAGNWFYLTGLRPEAFLHSHNNDVIGGLERASADVFLDAGDSLRVFTYGYKVDFEESLFGALDRDGYSIGLALVDKTVNVGFLVEGQPRNDLLGGALFEVDEPVANEILRLHLHDSE